MNKSAIIYTRVSTDEQAEHGYSLQSQSEACRDYAVRNGFDVAAEIKDDLSGSKLQRPGLDRVRQMVKERQVDAVIVFSPDRLTRQLAHSLILREEMLNANVELHYCNRGKSENTPEAKMTENIEAVFADYWRTKIIESSRRGRITKAASGKWPCDGHAAYGYRKDGRGRDARLVPNEEEVVVVQRIFAMFTGADGVLWSLQAIAALLTAEEILPPNRGYGVKRPGAGWYRQSVRNILMRRSYIGEFHYSEHTILLPELAIIPTEVFMAAQKRILERRAVSHTRPQKHHYLLSGRVRCTCGSSMPGCSTQQGKYLYYSCCSKLNKRHIRTCRERMIACRHADEVVWNWVRDLLCDEQHLEQGIKELRNTRDTELLAHRERVIMIDNLMVQYRRQIERLVKAFGAEEDELIAQTLQQEMRNAKRCYDALQVEKEQVDQLIRQQQITDEEITKIKQFAAKIRGRLASPSPAIKRKILTLLDVQVQLEHREDRRCLKVYCTLSPTQVLASEPTSPPSTTTTVREKSSSTTMKSHPIPM